MHAFLGAKGGKGSTEGKWRAELGLETRCPMRFAKLQYIAPMLKIDLPGRRALADDEEGEIDVRPGACRHHAERQRGHRAGLDDAHRLHLLDAGLQSRFDAPARDWLGPPSHSSTVA